MDASLLRSILVIAWWIGIWGLTDTIIHSITASSVLHKIIIYSSIILLVLGTVALKPSMIKHL
jgi:hypothetical protein